MAVPKKKTSKSKRNQRRSHDSLPNSVYIEDKTTGDFHRPHHVDMKTGLYRGKKIFNIESD